MLGIVGVMSASVSGVASGVLIFEMVDKVNEKLPKENRFTGLGAYHFEYGRLKRQYNILYPSGNLSRRVRALRVLMFACCLVAALALFGH
jgi:hypothetical protein